MKIAMAHQIHAYLTFVTVGHTKNAPEQLIHVQKDTANVARMTDVRTQKLAGLENAKVCNFKSSAT